MSHLLKHSFPGAKRKFRAFHGWAGPIAHWPEKSPPRIQFGKFIPNRNDPYHGGIVEFACEPFDLVMYGANSPNMDRRDKYTFFGFAALAPQGELKIARLPTGCDARKLYAAGGWPAPKPEELAADLIALLQRTDLTAAILKEKLDAFYLEIKAGYGIDPRQLKDIAASWPMLAPIDAALQEAVVMLAKLMSPHGTRLAAA